MKKGCSWLIHVLDFVKEENGQLIVCNEEGVVVKDACCIIYPGMGGDLWWNHKQLLMQVNKAIEIFKEVHPDCIMLFVFNQLSAHTSLGNDALRAFNMNRSNGGTQKKQRDTVILMNNLCPEFCGKAQKMTTKAGAAKGLQQMLVEYGFNIGHMHAKCSPICPLKNTDCCMARLLSKHDDFQLQESLLEKKIKGR